MFEEFFMELNQKGVRIPLANDTTILPHYFVVREIKFILENSRTPEILNKEQVDDGVYRRIKALKAKEPTLLGAVRELSELVRTVARQEEIALGPKEDAVVYISSLVNTLVHAILVESAKIVLDANRNSMEPPDLLTASMRIFSQNPFRR